MRTSFTRKVHDHVPRRWQVGIIASVMVSMAGLSELRSEPLQGSAVGNPGLQGKATQLDGYFVVEGAGADISATSDQFQFVYRTLQGDGSLTARVQIVENTHKHAKAGVMIRENLDADARHFSTVIHANGGVRFQRRVVAREEMVSGGEGSGFPRWVRITKENNVISSWESADGTKWKQLGEETLEVDLPTAYIGFAVCSRDNNQLATAVFDSIVFTGGGLSSGRGKAAPHGLTADLGRR